MLPHTDERAMQEFDSSGPQGGSNKKIILIVLGVLAALGFFGLLCCGGAMFYGFNEVKNVEKVYYAECEDTPDDTTCSACCAKKGHSGHFYGEFLNEEGKTCGCLEFGGAP